MKNLFIYLRIYENKCIEIRSLETSGNFFHALKHVYYSVRRTIFPRNVMSCQLYCLAPGNHSEAVAPFLPSVLRKITYLWTIFFFFFCTFKDLASRTRSETQSWSDHLRSGLSTFLLPLGRFYKLFWKILCYLFSTDEVIFLCRK